eukprot:scaffold665269_cov37-Prasinocladus_malaysianus.AAC.1
MEQWKPIYADMYVYCCAFQVVEEAVNSAPKEDSIDRRVFAEDSNLPSPTSLVTLKKLSGILAAAYASSLRHATRKPKVVDVCLNHSLTACSGMYFFIG